MTVVVDGIEYLPAAAVAESLDTTEIKVLMLLRDRALAGELFDGFWYVTAESLASYDKAAADKKGALQCRTACSSGCSCG